MKACVCWGMQGCRATDLLLVYISKLAVKLPVLAWAFQSFTGATMVRAAGRAAWTPPALSCPSWSRRNGL